MALAAYHPEEPGAQPAANLDEARRYLRLLYGERAQGYLNLCTFDGTPIEWFPATDLEEIAQRAVVLAESHNVYHSIAPRSNAFYESLSDKDRSKERGGSGDVVALPGLWLDVDFLDPVHKKTNLPPTPRAALALIAEFPLKPTLVIHSGHGFQPWWIFQDPWSLDNDEERARAQALLDRFHSVMLSKAKAHGWALDNTRDLARVFRVAGTVNRKDPSNLVLVQIIFCDETRRYRPEDFEPYLVAVEPPATRTNGSTRKAVAFECPSSNLNDEELLKRAMSARNGEKFTRLWIGDLTDYGDDDSAADLALSDMLAFWTNRDPVRMDRLYRQSALYRPKWDEVHYANGETHGQHTIAVAIAKITTGYIGTYIISADGECTGCDDQDGGSDAEQRGEPCADLIAEIEYLRGELARARSESATLRRVHSAQWRVFANPKLKGVGITAAKLVSEASSALGRDQDDDGWISIMLSGKYGLGAAVGKSDRRVSDDVAKLEEWGFIEKQVVTERIGDGEFAGQIRTHMYVRHTDAPLEILDALATFDPKRPSWGGKRVPRCAEHPDADVIRSTTYICKECGQILGEPHEQILIGSGQDGYPAEAPGEADHSDRHDPETHLADLKTAATWAEIPAQTSCLGGNEPTPETCTPETTVITGTLGGQDDGSGPEPVVSEGINLLHALALQLWPGARLVEVGGERSPP